MGFNSQECLLSKMVGGIYWQWLLKDFKAGILGFQEYKGKGKFVGVAKNYRSGPHYTNNHSV
jgi:hypothetical protein